MGDTQLLDRAGCPQLSAATERSVTTGGRSHDSRQRGESVRRLPQIGSVLYFVNQLIRER